MPKSKQEVIQYHLQVSCACTLWDGALIRTGSWAEMDKTKRQRVA
jgi:hypothetical protein